MELRPQQKEALSAIKGFLANRALSVFILKGYAGTGKTTLIKSLVPTIEEAGMEACLLAPTGRAAKVLREKSEHSACTIHRGIYSFDEMQAVRHDEKGELIETSQTADKRKIRSKGSDDLQLWFSLKQQEPNDNPARKVFVVDEASMISSRPNNNEYLHFGTDVLIDDLLTFVQPHLGGKIIFVGDPAQLPPVGDNRSVALEEAYFEDKKLPVKTYELIEVLRQGGESVILKNAMLIRNLLHAEQRNQLCFERKKGEVEDIYAEQVVDSFYDCHPHPCLGNAIILCYTNSLVKEYNDSLRHRYFPDCKNVVAGDLLQVVSNNVNTKLNIEYFNGDFVKVLAVSDKVETQSAPVWTDVAGERERVTISVDFRDAVLQSEGGAQTHCKIIDSLLNSREPNLTPLQRVALYINFRMRHPQLKPYEEAFKDSLMNDPYFNAVQVKYGYAITVHKSQGGEWKTAYVDYSGRAGLNEDSLRWAYTATTRAGEVLYGVNMPSITPMSAMKFKGITRISKPSKEAFSYAETEDVDFLPHTATAFQKQKCICVKEQLDVEGFYLKSIQPFQYNDRYTVETPSGTAVVDCFYNAAGQYTKFVVQTILPESETLKVIFEKADNIRYKVDYKPSRNPFEQLYAKITSLCDDLGITITNIVEHLSQFYISYYLKTSGKYSCIQFYFNSNGFISYGLPSSDIGDTDEKLQNLINRMQ